MPLQKLQFRPGVNRESTTLANEGGWFESDKVRWRSGYPEKIGGWTLDTGTTDSTLKPLSGSFWGVCRSMFNWLSLAGYNLLGLGTNLKYYIQNSSGGAFYDVTPLTGTPPGTAIAVASNAFTTTASASGSNRYVTVVCNASGYGGQTNDFVTISGLPTTTLNGTINASATSIVLTSASGFPASGSIQIESEQITYAAISTNTLTGCTRGANGTVAASHSSGDAVQIVYNGIPAANLTGEFQITYLSSGTFSIQVYVSSAVTVTAGTTGSADFQMQINTGSDIYTVGVGWGAGGWGGSTSGYSDTGWGDPAPAGLGIGIQLRVWSQSNFGQNLIINPRGGALYYWVADSNPNTFNRAQLLASTNTNTQNGIAWWQTDTDCPKICNYVLVSDASRFVLAFGVNDYGSTTQDPLLIRWSDQESVLDWTPSVTNQAGSYRLSQGSKIISAIQTKQEILVWTDAAIYSMQYLGAPYVWGFQIMGSNISIMSQNAVATANNVTYWMGADKFYMYSGRVETLPCTLRQYVFDDINLDQAEQFFAGTNEGYNEIWWFYCSANSTAVDKYVVFNYLEQTWYYGTLPRSSWLDSPLRQYPMATGYGNAVIVGSISSTTLTVTSITAGALSIGSIIVGDGIPSNTKITAYGTGSGALGTYTLNTISTVASEAMYGIPPQGSGTLIYHENGVDDGSTNPPSAINAYCQSSDFDIGDGHNFGFVWRIIPDVTFDGSTVNNPVVTFTVRPRQNPGTNYGSTDTPNVVSSQNYQGQQTYNVQQFTEYAYVRIRGRQMAFRIGSSDVGVMWQLGSPRLDVKPDGRR